jgi:hypothetical protein
MTTRKIVPAKKKSRKKTHPSKNLHGQEIGIDERGKYYTRFGRDGRQL